MLGHILSSLVYTSYSQCRIGVRMMIVSPKHYTAYSAILANSTQWLNTLLKKGTQTAFTGVVSDLYAPINNDAITTYYDKLIYIQNPYIATNIGEVGDLKRLVNF